MGTRIEILKEGLWLSLELASKQAIKYNAVINKIGKVATREISHTNTFSIPYIQQNTDALGINVFNKTTLAKSLNAKFKANYYVEDKLVRTGFVVINNTNGGTINLNFIDEALELLDKWGSTTYQELLRTTTLAIPDDYVSAIQELDYDMDPTIVLTPLSTVGSRGYNLALFPNSLNAIGDAFQLDKDDLRQDDHFNPYQCRPVWNVKAMFDLACEAYGYTPIFDDSVDWNKVADMYIIEAGQDKNEKGLSGVQTETYNTVSISQPHYLDLGSFDPLFNFGASVAALMLFPSTESLKPNEVVGWRDPFTLYGSALGQAIRPWMDKNCIFVAKIEGSNSGTLNFNYTTGNDGTHFHSVMNMYYPEEGCTFPYIWHDEQYIDTYSAQGTGNPYITITHDVLENGTSRNVNIEVDKAWYNIVAAGPINDNLIPALTSSTTQGSWDDSGGTISKSSNADSSIVYTFSTAMDASKEYYFLIKYGSFTGGELRVTLGTYPNLAMQFYPAANGFSSLKVSAGTALFINPYFQADASTITLSGTFIGEITELMMYELSDESVGIYVGTLVNTRRSMASDFPYALNNMTVTEEWLPPGVIAFDDFGQYLPSNPNLTHAAPRKSLKSLISAYMHKDGILMDVNAREKTVKFFNYGEYEENKVANNFIDFSEYLLKYSPITYNTDYGNAFAKKNRIGLSSPYPGNTYDYVLDNQGEESKFKDFTTNNNKLYQDIENVFSVPNTNNPYFEYTNQGLGLVEYGGELGGTLTQTRADGIDQGTFTNLPLINNVNGLVLPTGTEYWYDLIDKSVKVEAQFLIPVDRMNTLDMSLPVYVEELGGFFIIEQIQEYINGQTPVTIKLIKLIDDLRGYVATPIVTSISLSVSSIFPDGVFNFVNMIGTTTSFNNYTPTGASIVFRQLTDSITNGGTYSGYENTYVYAFDASTNYDQVTHQLVAQNPMTEFEKGHYEVQVTDSDGLQSNLAYATLGDMSVPPVAVTIYVETSIFPFGSNIPSGQMRVSYEYISHTPITSVLKYRKRDYLGNYQAPERQVDLMLSGNESPIIITPVDGAGFYEVEVVTDLASSPDPTTSGYFVT